MPIQNTTLIEDAAASRLVVTLEPDEEAIAELAYQLWAERGRPDGSPDEDWFRAKEILREGKAFSASSTST
jgi:hypothetical protein